MNKQRTVLYSALMENVEVPHMQQSIRELRGLAKAHGLELHNFAMSEGGCESDRIEALANDFLEAGHMVDFEDGACITIYA